MKRPFSFSFLHLLILAMSTAAVAQSCMTATCNATSPAQADVLAALPSSSNTNATVVVNIPGQTATWTSGINYTVPSGVQNLTIQGATSVNCTGTAGTSSYACTAADSTVFIDSYSGGSISLLNFNLGAANTVFRFTGITIQGGNGDSKYGVLSFGGNSQNLRVDHVHFNSLTYTSAQNSMLQINGPNEGVLDHNLVDLGSSNTATTNGFRIFNPIGDTKGFGDGTWASPTGFGTSAFIFIENNVFNGGAPNDCDNGGKFVMRYNTLNDSYVAIQTHGTKTAAGGWRGCRAYEAYHNYFTGPANSQASAAAGSKGGPALVWGNSMPQGYYRFFQAETDRNIPESAAEIAPPNGWGYCGTIANGNGVGSPWDGNSGNDGYPCLDGLGRGQTAQALNGQFWPNRLNSVTGTVAWPQQYLEPIYLWNNSIGSATYMMVNDNNSADNQDYYYDCGSANSTCSAGFTGAAGTGYGSLASRPSTCTAGPGGTYFASPTGSYGVAYFATDDNSGLGELYVCSSANTWTPIYQPYTYPHPLESGSPATAAAPSPSSPTNLTATVN